MAAVTISIEPGELQSLRALAELDAVTNGRQPDVPGVAAALIRRALAATVLILLWGGYARGWGWTGFRKRAAVGLDESAPAAVQWWASFRCGSSTPVISAGPST